MTKVKLTHTKAMQVAYIEHRGSFSSIPWEEDIGKLYGYAKAHKLRPAMRPMGIYPDDPKKVPEERLRSEVALPVRGPATPEGEIRVKALPETDMATVKFRGPTSDISRVYTEVHAWIQANGYVPAGAPMELYTKKPKVVGGRTELTAKIEIPVRRR
ncbi:MAG TPA: GyrI-like domain-containing protein [Candidatus Thermoplasmatota archaeon]|nr:GyrI-like domain-containing protein [Candidatus Thermoplasmatota archaeon]